MCILCGVARPTQTVQVANGELQYVGLLQFAHILSFSLQGTNHQILQFVQTLVDPRPPLPFQ
jgi:hypothetical protein